MSNKFVSLPVPAGNGTGAAVDVTAMGGGLRTLIVSGTFKATVEIQISGDGTVWDALTSFTNADYKNVADSAAFMRVKVSGFQSGAPVVNVGSGGLGAGVVQLPVPAGGAGTAVDISALAAQKTLICTGGPTGGSLTVQISDDGVTWVPFHGFQGPGSSTNMQCIAKLMRVVRSGGTGGTIWVTSANDAATAGGETGGNAPFESKLTTIYVRTTGDDETGNGALATPYRTFQRAVLDVPNVLSPGARYAIDVTDLGIETFPSDYQVPVVQSTFDAELHTVVDHVSPWLFDSGLDIVATPKLSAAIPAADAVIAFAEVVSVLATDIELAKITTTKVWPVGALKGMMLTGRGTASTNCAIYDNTATELFVANQVGNVTPIAGQTLRIVEPSATFQGPAPTRGQIQGGAFNVLNCNSIGLKGIKFLCTDATPEFHGLTIGNCPQGHIELCDVEGLFAVDSTEQLYFNGVARNKNVDVEGYTPWTPRRSYLTNLQVILSDFFSIYREVVLEDCASIGGNPFGASNGGFQKNVECRRTLFLTSTSHAINCAGGGLYNLEKVKMDTCAGDAIHADQGRAFVMCLLVIGSANTGYGINCQDGSEVRVFDDATVVTGALGDMKVGALTVRTWADFRANVPTKNQMDLATPFILNVASGETTPGGDDVTGAGTGGYSGSRVFQKAP